MGCPVSRQCKRTVLIPAFYQRGETSLLPQEFIYQLKQANPIEQVMGSYVRLIKAGSLLKCQCPFHSEKTPS